MPRSVRTSRYTVTNGSCTRAWICASVAPSFSEPMQSRMVSARSTERTSPPRPSGPSSVIGSGVSFRTAEAVSHAGNGSQAMTAAPPAEARRIVFTAVRKAEWERVPLPAPDALGPTQVLLRTECSVVSAGTETANYAGTHIDFQQPGRRVPIPFRPGYALAGRVVAVGTGVEDLKPGDRVAASTNHADWAVIDTTRTRMVKLPDGVTGEQGCLARLSAIAFQGVRLARVALGEQVAVFGQGLIGQFARQYAAIDGAVKIGR